MPQAAFKSGDQDPSSVATNGVEGTIFAKRTAPYGVYQKQDNGSSTNWALVSGGSSALNVVATQTANYNAVVNDLVPADSSGGTFNITLPTAVGQSGKQILVQKIDSSPIDIPINTTGGQTAGGRASGDIKLRQLGDYALFVSDNANWLCVDKKETQYLSSFGTRAFSLIGSPGNYGANAASVALTYGIWEIDSQFALYCGTGIAPAVSSNSGFYAADGADSAAQPTLLGAEVIEGNALFATEWGTPLLYNNTTNPGDNSRWASGNNKIVISITANQTIYLVPQIDFSTAGSAEVTAIIKAKRIW